MVLAADVLYEQRDIVPLIELIPRILGPRGYLWLAEPGRVAGGRVIELMRAAGWSDRVKSVPFNGLGQKLVVDLHRLARPH